MADRLVGYELNGTPRTYTTLAAAYAAASPMDRLLVRYRNPNGDPIWYESISAGYVTKPVSIIGDLPNRKVAFVNGGWFYALDGDMSSITTQLTIKNITLTNLGYLGYGFTYNDTVGNGEGYLIEDCLFNGLDFGIIYANGKNYGMIIRNCLFVGCNTAVYVTIPVCSIVGNTFARCNVGVQGFNAWIASVMYNNLALNCNVPYTDNYAFAYWDASNNVSDTASYPPPGINGQIVSRTAAKIQADAGVGFDTDYRLQATSPLIGAGVAHADMSVTDIDGRTRGTPPAIGCSEGVGVYPAGAPAPGDIIYRDGVWRRLPKGLEDQVLKVVNGLPTWVTA